MQAHDTPNNEATPEALSAQPDVAPTDAPQTDATATTESTPSLEEMIRKAELQAAEHHDAWLRAKAETENVRRRATEDIAKPRNSRSKSSRRNCWRSRTALKLALPPKTRAWKASNRAPN